VRKTRFAALIFFIFFLQYINLRFTLD